MDSFIESFDIETGCVSSINKSYSDEMVFEPYYDGVELKSIGKYACNGGSATIVDLSNTGITLLDDYSFASCPITKIIFPDSLTDLNSNTFLKSTVPYIYIPANLTSVSYYAFNWAYNITYFDVSPDNTKYSSVNGFLMDKKQTTIIGAPRNITNEADFPYHESITIWALCATSLQRYIANSSLESLSVGAFYATKQLILLDLSKANLISLPSRVVESSSVKTLILPEKLESLATSTFTSKISFKRLIIPASCNSLSECVFNCTGEITVIYLGSVDFSPIKIFSSELSKVKVYVTPYYIQEYFGCVKVIRNWINEPFTVQRKHFISPTMLFNIFLFAQK